MLDIQTDPIEHLPIKNLHETSISNISVSDSKYRSGIEIPTPTSSSVLTKLVDINCCQSLLRGEDEVGIGI